MGCFAAPVVNPIPVRTMGETTGSFNSPMRKERSSSPYRGWAFKVLESSQKDLVAIARLVPLTALLAIAAAGGLL
jgi:hypothetical protein